MLLFLRMSFEAKCLAQNLYFMFSRRTKKRLLSLSFFVQIRDDVMNGSDPRLSIVGVVVAHLCLPWRLVILVNHNSLVQRNKIAIETSRQFSYADF